MEKSRFEKIIREDLMDLSRIQEIGLLESMYSLLPAKIGSPLSILSQSLREDLSVVHETISRWISYLIELYFLFELPVYSKSIARFLKKEKNIFLRLDFLRIRRG